MRREVKMIRHPKSSRLTRTDIPVTHRPPLNEEDKAHFLKLQSTIQNINKLFSRISGRGTFNMTRLEPAVKTRLVLVIEYLLEVAKHLKNLHVKTRMVVMTKPANYTARDAQHLHAVIRLLKTVQGMLAGLTGNGKLTPHGVLWSKQDGLDLLRLKAELETINFFASSIIKLPVSSFVVNSTKTPLPKDVKVKLLQLMEAVNACADEKDAIFKRGTLFRNPSVGDERRLVQIGITIESVKNDIDALDVNNRLSTSAKNAKISKADKIILKDIADLVKIAVAALKKLRDQGTLIKENEKVRPEDNNSLKKIQSSIKTIQDILGSFGFDAGKSAPIIARTRRDVGAARGWYAYLKSTGKRPPFSLEYKSMLLQIKDSVQTIQQQIKMIINRGLLMPARVSIATKVAFLRMRGAMQTINAQLDALNFEDRDSAPVNSSGPLTEEDKSSMLSMKYAMESLRNQINKLLSDRTLLPKTISLQDEMSVLRIKGSIERMQTLINVLDVNVRRAEGAYYLKETGPPSITTTSSTTRAETHTPFKGAYQGFSPTVVSPDKLLQADNLHTKSKNGPSSTRPHHPPGGVTRFKTRSTRHTTRVPSNSPRGSQASSSATSPAVTSLLPGTLKSKAATSNSVAAEKSNKKPVAGQSSSLSIISVAESSKATKALASNSASDVQSSTTELSSVTNSLASSSISAAQSSTTAAVTSNVASTSGGTSTVVASSSVIQSFAGAQTVAPAASATETTSSVGVASTSSASVSTALPVTTTSAVDSTASSGVTPGAMSSSNGP